MIEKSLLQVYTDLHTRLSPKCTIRGNILNRSVEGRCGEGVGSEGMQGSMCGHKRTYIHTVCTLMHAHTHTHTHTLTQSMVWSHTVCPDSRLVLRFRSELHSEWCKSKQQAFLCLWVCAGPHPPTHQQNDSWGTPKDFKSKAEKETLFQRPRLLSGKCQLIPRQLVSLRRCGSRNQGRPHLRRSSTCTWGVHQSRK